MPDDVFGIPFVFVCNLFAVPKASKASDRQETVSFTGSTGVAFGLVISVAAAVGVALLVLAVVFRRQRRHMHALQRVIDSGAAVLDQGVHSASSVGMTVLNTSSSGIDALNGVGGTTGADHENGGSDPDLALHRTAAMYDSLATSSSPA